MASATGAVASVRDSGHGLRVKYPEVPRGLLSASLAGAWRVERQGYGRIVVPRLMHKRDRGLLAEPMAEVKERRQSRPPGNPVATSGGPPLVLASVAHQAIDRVEHRRPSIRRAVWAWRRPSFGEPQDLGAGWHMCAHARFVLLVRLREVEPQNDVRSHDGCPAVRGWCESSAVV